MSIRTAMEHRRLTREDWLDAGMGALEREGHKALRAEKLAKQLNVSRGSFYWHFADVAAFEQALLEAWFEMALDAPYARAVTQAAGDPLAALRNIIEAAFAGPKPLERAVRQWAAVAPSAAQAVARLDDLRVNLMTDLMPPPAGTQRARALIAYRTYLGHIAAEEGDPGGAVAATLIDLLCPAAS